MPKREKNATMMEKTVTSSNLRSMAHAVSAARMIPWTMPPEGPSERTPMFLLAAPSDSSQAQLQMNGMRPSKRQG